MTDFEVFVDVAGEPCLVGFARRNAARGRETVVFEYDASWLASERSFALEPALPLASGPFAPPADRAIFAGLSDSAPDTWGRRLMQLAERRAAAREQRTVRTLSESDYLLGVTDLSRLGALRFRYVDRDEFEAPSPHGVPPLVQLGRLLAVSERVLRDEASDADLLLMFAPGSSLGGARPKASVLDAQGRLSIAKFPRETDEYSIERWESVALSLAARAGISTAPHQLVTVAGRVVLLSRRFDRTATGRVPFLSALAMTGGRDGERGSYPDVVDALTRHGAKATADARGLYRRVVFNVLVSNVDDHMRNHGFLRAGEDGWRLAPAYDLNPVPTDVKARVLSTNIDLDEGTCSLELLESAAGYFGLGLADARKVIKAVALATSSWREVARDAGARAAEVSRMESAFEHADLQRALVL